MTFFKAFFLIYIVISNLSDNLVNDCNELLLSL